VTAHAAGWPEEGFTLNGISSPAGNGDGHGRSLEERDLAARVRREVADRLTEQARAGEDGVGADWAGQGGQDAGWTLIGQVLDEHAQTAMRTGQMVLDPDVEARVARTVFDALFGMGGFSPLLADPAIENIFVNGADQVHVRYADGSSAQAGPVADSDEELIDLIRTLAARAGSEERRFDRGVPRVSVTLPDGSRLFAVTAVTPRPSVTIRRHRYPTTTLEELRRLGTVDAGLRDFLTALVLAKKNILIAGGTNLGKTTLLRGLASAIPAYERLVTIEDAYELGLHHDTRAHPNVVPFQAREPNIEGQGEVTQSDLVVWALRMSPDRVIVGEIRGPEVIPMCNAMSQGNDGSMATIHASTSKGVFDRLASYAVQAPEKLDREATNLLVANAVDVIVQLAWSDGRRVVSSIREVIDADGRMIVSNEVFRPDHTGRAVPGVALRQETLEDLVDVGFDYTLMHRSEGWWDT
jgi:Flp pilus assembly CpaF family ATPase